MYIDVNYQYTPWRATDLDEESVTTIWVYGDNPSDDDVKREFYSCRRPLLPDVRQGGRAWGAVLLDWHPVDKEEMERRNSLYPDELPYEM